MCQIMLYALHNTLVLYIYMNLSLDTFYNHDNTHATAKLQWFRVIESVG